MTARERFRAVTDSGREIIQIFAALMLFSLEGGDAKSSIMRRKTQRKVRKDVDLDKFSKVLSGSADDNVMAETTKMFCIYLSALRVVSAVA